MASGEMRFVRITWSTKDITPLTEAMFKDLEPISRGDSDITLLRWSDKLEWLVGVNEPGTLVWAEVK